MTAIRMRVSAATHRGDRVTLTATPTSRSLVNEEGGWVTFFDHGQPLGTTELLVDSVTSTAILTLPSLPDGTRHITATFEPFFGPKISVPFHVRATPAA